MRRLLALQRQHAPATCEAILPGARPAAIAAAEEACGFDWPGELKAVLLESAGGLPLPGWSPLTTLPDMLAGWELWASIAEGLAPEDLGYSLEDLQAMRLQPAYCHARLITLTAEPSYGPLADMAPGGAGQAGQIVSISHGGGMRWEAPSLADFLHVIADAIEDGRITYSAKERDWIDASTGNTWFRLHGE